MVPVRPEETRNIVVIGLTGGVGSGKSTVALLFEKLGIPVIDTDKVGHDLLAETDGRLARSVVGRFGEAVLAPDGSIDRKKLGAVVFGDAVSRGILESILHPAIADRVWTAVKRASTGGADLVVLEVPLLFEAGWDKLVDVVIAVDLPVEVQIERVQARNGSAREAVLKTIEAQTSRETRLKGAHYVIDNSGNREVLEERVEAVVREISATFHLPVR